MACSSTIHIGEASPFGWTISDCDPRPAINSVLAGSYCQPVNTSDGFHVQIEYDGAGSPELRVYNDTDDTLMQTTAFTIRKKGYTLYDGSTYDAYFDVSFLPDNIQVRLEVWDTTQLAVSESIVAESDTDCTVLITYTNGTSLGGIDYAYGLENNIRINGHFWQLQIAQNSTLYEQTNGTINVLKRQVRNGGILKTDYMPGYMHEKLALIFMHSAIEINGQYYYSDTDYTFEPLEETDVFRGQITLNERTTLLENIL